jgi:phosphatidylglycerophosphate synthase
MENNYSNTTFLECLFTQLWKRFETYIPAYITANHITIVGQLFHVASYLLYLQEYFLYASISYFIYVQLDGIDGIIARKRNQQSRIGEWLDHMFDSLSIAIMYSISQRLNIGFFFIAYTISYVLMHIEDIIAGKIRYNAGCIGAMEIQLLISGLLLFAELPYIIVLFINLNALIIFPNLYLGYKSTNGSSHYLICSLLITTYTLYMYSIINIPLLMLPNIAAVNSHLTNNLYLFYYRIVLYFFVSFIDCDWIYIIILVYEMLYYPKHYLFME